MSVDEVRTVQLQLLDQLDAYCRTHRIRYHLAFGTLLGAVRHEGYIPWDDDIDVTMPRTDYERFCESTAVRPIGESVIVGSIAHQTAWPFVYAKVMSTSTTLFEESDLDFPLGVYVDVFPIDGLPSNRLVAWAQMWTLKGLRTVMMAQAISHNPSRPLVRRILIRVTKLFGAQFSRTWLARQRVRIATRYPFDRSEEVGLYSGEVFARTKRRHFEDSIAADFEGRSLPIPTAPEAVLTAIYGDYTRLPPIEQRVSHHAFTAYACTPPGTAASDGRSGER